MKLKAKLNGDSAEVKILCEHPQMGREEAETKKQDKANINYITHITAKVNDKVVFEASTGPFLSKDPYFKFDIKGAKAGDKVSVDWIDKKGGTKTADVVIK